MTGDGGKPGTSSVGTAGERMGPTAEMAAPRIHGATTRACWIWTWTTSDVYCIPSRPPLGALADALQNVLAQMHALRD